MKPRPFSFYAPAVDNLLLQVTLQDLLKHIGEWYVNAGLENRDSRLIVAGGDVLDLSNRRMVKRCNDGPDITRTAAERAAARRNWYKSQLIFDTIDKE